MYSSKGYYVSQIPNQVNNRHNRERLLLLGQGIDSEISNQLTSLMVYQSIVDVNWTAQEEILK